VALGLFVFFLESPLSGILPMGIVAYLCKERLKKFFDRFSLPVSFLLEGTFFSLLTETFALLGNLHLPLTKRALLKPYPAVDLILGFFWYGLFTLVWYLLLRKFIYSKKEIFLLAGIYGLIFEQGSVFLAGMFASVPGFIIGIFIMPVFIVYFQCLLIWLLSIGFLSERNFSSLCAMSLREPDSGSMYFCGVRSGSCTTHFLFHLAFLTHLG